MLASAATLLVGIASDEAEPIALSLGAAAGALILLWVGVTRSSGPSQRDGQG